MNLASRRSRQSLALAGWVLMATVSAQVHAQPIEMENEYGSTTIRSPMGAASLQINPSGTFDGQPSPFRLMQARQVDAGR